jgi:hypothetical protein
VNAEPLRPLPLWLAGLHLAALWGFAIVQPLFDLLGRNADFFVARGSTSGDIVAFALATTLIPPLVFLGIEALAGLAGSRPRAVAHLVLVGLLAAIIAVGLLKKVIHADSAVLFPISAAIGLGAALLYANTEPARSFVTVLTAAPALFLVLFLFESPVHKLVFSGEAKAQAAHLTSRTPVVMVSFDEFPITSLMTPDGRLDARRYPNFAAFARQAVWFHNATTVADGTRWATPIVISGQLPKKDALPTFQDYPQNLFTALGRGYSMHVTEPVTRLCPKSLCASTGPREVEAGDVAGTASPQDQDQGFFERMGSMFSDLGIVSLHVVLPDDLRAHLPSVSEQLGDFGKHQASTGSASEAQRKLRQATGRQLNQLIPQAKQAESAKPALPRFIDSIRPWDGHGKPPLYFIHVLLPHHPWHYLPSSRTYSESLPEIPGLRDNVWNDDVNAVNQGWQRHILQVGYVDRELGRLVHKLRAAGLFDRSLIVLASDHGVAFAPDSPRRRITPQDVGGIAPIPLFFKLPHERVGRVDQRHVQTVDILPTIAGALGFALPKRSDGHSALSRAFRPTNVVKIWSTTSTKDFGTVTVAYRQFLARRQGVLNQQAGLLGTGTRDPGLEWAVGPNRELVGRPLATVAQAGVQPAQVRFDHPEELRAWSPDQTWSPSHVSGAILGLPAGRTTPLAVAVNGRIAAVSWTYPFTGKARFSAIVPDSAFRPGANQVQVFEVQGSGQAASLLRLGG